jgi:mono/diheme cytochrome c family protein
MSTTPPVGRCEGCHQHRPLFEFTPVPEFWDAEPPAQQLCVRCYSRAEEAEERGEMPVSWLIDHGTDEQVARAFGLT